MSNDQLGVAAAGVFACLGVVALVPLVRRVALIRGITDRPAPGKLHRAPTPYLGGVAIAIVAAASTIILPEWTSFDIGLLLLAALAVGTVGLVDDIRTVRPGTRVAVEVLAATLAFAAGARVHLFGEALDYILTVGWLVILTNSFNLLDNMDGAAGGVASTIAVAVLAAALFEHQILVGGMAAVLAGACVGFLIHNWHPARIFMGDAGSLFIGFLLSAMALKLRFAVAPPASVVALLLIVGPALFDTTLVVVCRLQHGRSIFIGGTDHTSHRLLRLGLGTDAVAVLLMVGAAIPAALGVAVGRGIVPASIALAVVAPVAVLGLVGLLQIDVYGDASATQEPDAVLPTIEPAAALSEA